MTRGDILKKIAVCGGNWRPNKDIEIYRRGDRGESDEDGVNAVVEVDGVSVRFWLMGHYNKSEEFLFDHMPKIVKAVSMLDAAQRLASVLGIGIEGMAVKEKEEENEPNVQGPQRDERGEEFGVLKGKVEAYEGLLIGRAFTVQK